MPIYKEMYLTLIRAQRDAILLLQEAHQKTEEMFLSSDAPEHLRVLRLESLQKEKQADIRCLNLSTRVYNALTCRFGRHGDGGYVPTLKDVLSIASYEELKKIRKLGEKSHRELILKMQEVGFTDWAEQMLNELDRHCKR